tara:strand:+ start:2200 stop:2355 length:156 start_codon:yes stop_codon:yes gene_type:complete
MKYKIIRFYQARNKPSKTIKTGVTLAQAKKHCNDPKTSTLKYFDGFIKMIK